MLTQTRKTVDKLNLEKKVKSMYRDVALNPKGNYHFEMGYDLALRLGYSTEQLNRIPAPSVDSFAGVGYHFGLAAIKPGDKVLDLGSGSGMDLFIASHETGQLGHATGIDMTIEQLEKSKELAAKNKYANVSFVNGFIEELPFANNEFDVVISNGVINLTPEKGKVFLEIARVLKKGGRMAISDIITESQLPESVTCDAALWASCIGGALQEDEYLNHIEKVGLKTFQVIHNVAYGFISKSAMGASKQYGVKSVSLRADKL